MKLFHNYKTLVLGFIMLLINLNLNAQAQGCAITTSTFSGANTTAAAILDNTVTTSTITIAGAQSIIVDVNVFTNITHTSSADLDIVLISPAGTIVTLTTDNGGVNDNNFAGTTWDDDANPGGLYPFTTANNNGLVTDHLYANLTLATPLVPEEPLAAFLGENPNGVWTLKVSDDLAANTGTLNNWSLNFVTTTTLPAGTVTNHSSGNVNVPIPSGAPTTTSGNAAPSVIVVSGVNTYVRNVRLTTVINHTFASDLDITLTSPAGTVITLTSDNDAGNDNVFSGTLWDNDANPLGDVPYVNNNGLVTDHLYANLVVATPLTPEESFGAFFGENPNGNWTLNITDDLGGDFGTLVSWNLELTSLVNQTCNFVPFAAGQNPLALGTSAGICASNYSINAPATTGNCTGVNLVISYSVDGGPFTPGTTATGTFNPGNHTIVWRSQTDCGTVNVTQSITVADMELPTITCPPDQNVVLEAGKCAEIVSYEVTVSDNCPFEFPGSNTTTANRTAGNFTFDQIFFNVVNTGAFPVTITQINEKQFPAASMTWRVHSRPGTAIGFENTAVGWTLNGSNTVMTAAGGFAPIPLSIPITIAPGQTVGVAVSFPIAQTGTFAFGYAGAGTFTAPAPDANGIQIIDHGVVPTEFAGALLVPRGWIGSLIYTVGVDGAATQTAGLPSGAEFPVGTTTNCFTVTDVAGLTGNCCFAVTVTPFPFASEALACNDHVNISIDENCEILINSDMFLEGGPYGCYDEYEVYIWPYNVEANSTGNVSGATVDFGFLLGDHTVKVVDPETGNSCWGTVTIENKLPPTVECGDVTINCIEPLPTTPIPPFDASSIAGGAGFLIEDNTTDTVFFVVPDYVDCLVTDVDFLIDLTHTFIGDINMRLISPQGTAVTLWGNLCGATDNMDFVIDDEGTSFPPTTLCVDVVTLDINLTIPGFVPAQPMSTFDGQPAAGTWMLIYSDNFAADEGLINNMELRLNGCLQAGFFPTPICGPDYTWTSSDLSLENQCGGFIERTWTATNSSGLSASCVQNITIEVLTLADVVLPPSLVETSCGVDYSPEGVSAYFDIDSRSGTGIGGYNDDWTEAAGSPAGVVELNEGYAFGYPHYFAIGRDGNLHAQKIDNSVCNILSNYTDLDFPACGNGCGGNIKIVRTWSLLDWCNLEVGQFSQLIKAVDFKAPTFIVKDVTVGVNPWGCVANFDIPNPWELQDNCDAHPNWTVQGPAGVSITYNPATGIYRASDVPKGVHQFLYKAWDCCGNESFAFANITVIDRSAPVAVAKQNIVISLTGSGTDGDGAAKLYAYHVDNGSYDHCSAVRLEIRRPEGAPDCGNLGIDDYNNNETFDDDDSASPNVRWAHPEDDRDDTDNGEYVKFCCEDLAGTTSAVHQAILRVWDDGNMNGVIGDNLILDGMQDNYNETWADIRVEDKLPPTLVCPDDVTVTCDMDINISEGVWVSVDGVDMTMTGGPAVAYALCSGNPVEYRDVPTWTNTCQNVGRVRREFRSVKGATTVNCYQIITVAALPSTFVVTPPTSSIVDTDCDFTAADIKDSEKPRVLSGPCDVIGENIDIDTFFFEDGVCKKWRVTYEYINWCTGEVKPGGVKWYKYKDEEKPVLTCADAMFPANPNPQNPNGVCEGTVTLTASATDAGGCTDNGWLKWVVFIDLWGNGSIDLEYSSFLPTTDNNLGNDTNGNGIPDRYVAPTSSGDNVTIPAFVLEAELSTHKVTWKVTDGCGNFTNCSSTFMVVDKKAPTPYCVSLSSAVMENGEVELWAKDFDKGSFDNCTPQSNLLFTFNGEMPVWTLINVDHYFKGIGVLATAAEYAAGTAQRWSPSARSSAKIFDCDDVENSPVEVQMTVWDQNGNSDYCSVTLTLIDNQGACGGSKTIAGALVNNKEEEISNVIVTIDPSISETKVETVDGAYSSLVPVSQDYTVIPTKADDYKNGVNTLDLVHIQRHILGTAKLNSPEKLIAADINADAKITANDLVELRKLILGLTAKLNNNDSWVFVPKSYVYPDVNNPYNAPRSISIYNIQNDVTGQDFRGIKVGDVDQTASASFTSTTSGNRSAKNLTLTAEDKNVATGDVVTLDVTANNFKDVFGYQFTANLAGMELVEVKSGAVAMDETNYGIPVAGKMTMSWSSENGLNVADGEVLFTLVMRATTSGKVSNMIALNSDVTNAESYGAGMSANGIELNFRNGATSNATYALYQNEPNPFKATTSVSFNMAEAAQAEFTLTDVTGKVVYTRTVDAVKGMNTVEFNRNEVATSGIVYYTITSGEFTATKAMIVIE